MKETNMILPLKGSTLSYKNAKKNEMCPGSNVWPMTYGKVKRWNRYKKRKKTGMASARKQPGLDKKELLDMERQ